MNKRILMGTASLATSIFLFSNIVLASTTSYKFRLPTVGTKYTSYATKQTNSGTLYNRVSYFGWSGSEIQCWAEDTNGGQVTSTSQYTGTGNVKMYMSNPYDYKLKNLRMATKTASNTWHECDVQGVFDPQ